MQTKAQAQVLRGDNAVAARARLNEGSGLRPGERGGSTNRVLEPLVDAGTSRRGHQEDLLVERIMEGTRREIEGRLLKRILEGLLQKVDDLLRSRVMEDLPQEKGRAATGDQRGDRSAVHQVEDEDRRPGAVQKGGRHSVLRRHEWEAGPRARCRDTRS